MPFDLATARPAGGFDLTTAQPVRQDFAKQNPGEYDPSSPQYQAKYGPMSEAPTARRPLVADPGEGGALLAGAGKAFVDLGRGAGQMLGLVSRQQVADSRAQDAPLMATTAGKFGNVAGNVAATLPALAVPGANTVAGAGLLGAGLGFMQPSTSTQETLLNTGIGGAAGAAGQYVGNRIAGAIGNRLAGRAATAANNASTNAVRDQTLAEGRAAGYVVPPTEVNPSAVATALESISGKAATKHAAQATNQRVTNRLVAEDLGLPANHPLTQQALAGVRQQAGQVYARVAQAGQIAPDAAYVADIRNITNGSQQVQTAFPGAVTPAGDRINALVTSLDQPGFSAGDALAYTQRLRQQATANFAAAGRTADPEARALAQAQRDGADALEEMIGRHLQQNGQPDLLNEFQEARTTLAKSWQAQAALKGGNVSATKLAAQLQRGRPMTDGFSLIARFADHFDQATKLPKGGVGVSKLAAAMAAENIATGHWLAAALSAPPSLVRRGILSNAGQNALAMPNYAPGMLGTGALNALGTAGRYGALPAYLSASQLAQAQEEQAPQ